MLRVIEIVRKTIITPKLKPKKTSMASASAFENQGCVHYVSSVIMVVVDVNKNEDVVVVDSSVGNR
jgi:hypothetical protein